MSYCENCGTKKSDGICPNCHEELFIVETQTEFLPDYLSQGFIEKVDRQRQEIKDEKERSRDDCKTVGRLYDNSMVLDRFNIWA